MTKNQQIEEMTKIVWDNPNMYDLPSAEDVAFALYDAGYRKASDVARQIFEDIEDVMKTWTIIPSSDYCGYGGYLEIDVDKTFAELKKKYESEGE